MTTQPALNIDMLDSLLNQSSIAIKEMRNALEKMQDVHAQLESLRPVPVVDDIPAQWEYVYRTWSAGSPPPTNTQLSGNKLTVFVNDPEWFKQHGRKDALQRMLSKRVGRPIEIKFEADPHEATADTTPEAKPATPQPGEGDGKPAQESPEPETDGQPTVKVWLPQEVKDRLRPDFGDVVVKPTPTTNLVKVGVMKRMAEQFRALPGVRQDGVPSSGKVWFFLDVSRWQTDDPAPTEKNPTLFLTAPEEVGT